MTIGPDSASAATTALTTAKWALGTAIASGILAGGASLAVAVFNHRHEEEMAGIMAAHDDRNAAHQAERDYVYEARKRLYAECEPLLFRFAEACENTLFRVYSLARTARDGDLGPNKPNWLTIDPYYVASTLYNLLCPAAVYRMLQDKLTLVDMAVDERIATQYAAAKLLAITWTDAFDLAAVDPRLPYAPFDPNWQTMRLTQPAVYWLQGVPIGRLDRATEAMVKVARDRPARLVTFGEFDDLLKKDLKGGGAIFGAFADVFDGFHPDDRPVLWRMLVAQAVLCRWVVGSTRRRGPAAAVMIRQDDSIDGLVQRLVWRAQAGPGGTSPEDAARAVLRAAEGYLRPRVPSGDMLLGIH